MTRTTVFSALLMALLAPALASGGISFEFDNFFDASVLGGRAIHIHPSPLPFKGQIDIDVWIENDRVKVYVDGQFADEELYNYGGLMRITFWGDSGETQPYNVTFWGKSDPSRFAVAAIGGKGDDFFENRTKNPAYFQGKEGSDELIGNFGPDILVGGDDGDLIIGGGGDDFLYGNEVNYHWLSGLDWFADEFVWQRMFSPYGLGTLDDEVGFRPDGGDDVLLGGDGDDYLDPGFDGEPDVCTGGNGADIFLRAYYPPGDENSYPTDYNKSAGDSQIKLKGVGRNQRGQDSLICVWHSVGWGDGTCPF